MPKEFEVTHQVTFSLTKVVKGVVLSEEELRARTTDEAKACAEALTGVELLLASAGLAEWSIKRTECIVRGVEDIMLTHPDTVSGTSVFTDGVKVYWTEGYSEVVILHPDGGVEKVDSQDLRHPMLARERAFELTKHEVRGMTDAELHEWEAARGCVGDWAKVLAEDDRV